MHAATFILTDDDPRHVIAPLVDLGFEFGTGRPVTTTLLDTFDGRLHRAGLQLALHEGAGRELVLSGNDCVPAHLEVTAAPRLAADLPSGPFRSRLADLTDVRALLPQLRVMAEQTPAAWRDATGKVVATAALNQAVSVVDRPGIGGPTTTIEIHAVTGYPGRARRAVEVLNRLGLGEYYTDTMWQWATAADVDLAGFASSATVPLDPEMSAVDGYRVVLANLAVEIRANWQGTIDQSDTEFLHDLRIAIRRTRTVVAAAKSTLPTAVLDDAREGFAWLVGPTGPARDLDVYLLEWDHYTAPLGADVLPSLAPVRDLLERRRAEAHIDLEQALSSRRAADLMKRWTTWLNDPLAAGSGDDEFGRLLGRVVATRIARAHGVVLNRGRLIGPDTPAEQVHDVRKDAKKLRYLLECFGGLLPEAPRKRYVKTLKALQDNLGEHQDAEVHVAMLRAVARQLHEAGASSDTMVAIGQLTERLDQQRLAARAEFAERFADYDTPATQRSLDAVIEAISR